MADRAAGQVGSGKRFISSTTADSAGHFVAGLDAGVQGKNVTVDVTNTSGSTSEFSTNVAVPLPRQNNVPPTAAFTSSCSHLSCTFSAAGSSDTDGSVVNWVWDYGDGNTDQGTSPSHTYAHRGSYTVTLTVVDNDGGTGTVTHTAAAVNASPTAVIGASSASTWVARSTAQGRVTPTVRLPPTPGPTATASRVRVRVGRTPTSPRARTPSA